MTSPNQPKPREFWIRNTNKIGPIELPGDLSVVFATIKPPEFEPKPRHEVIHVIERSYATSLEQEIEVLRGALIFYRTKNNYTNDGVICKTEWVNDHIFSNPKFYKDEGNTALWALQKADAIAKERNSL